MVGPAWVGETGVSRRGKAPGSRRNVAETDVGFGSQIAKKIKRPDRQIDRRSSDLVRPNLGLGSRTKKLTEELFRSASSYTA